MPAPLYEQRLLTFQFALIGRLFLPQGSPPHSTEDLKTELSTCFGNTGEWVLMPLGKGFFSLAFNIREDQIKAARRTSWKLSSGWLHIRERKPNFDPYKEISLTTQIWVRLFHLPVEYRHPQFLVGIFRAVGNVIKLDDSTAHGLVGHFARALVEIGLKSSLLETIRVGLPDNLFYVDFSYENVPLLCSFCHYIGHSVEKCRKACTASLVSDEQQGPVTKPYNATPEKQHGFDTSDEQRGPDICSGTIVARQRKKRCVEKAVENMADVQETFSNTFAALQDDNEELVAENPTAAVRDNTVGAIQVLQDSDVVPKTQHLTAMDAGNLVVQEAVQEEAAAEDTPAAGYAAATPAAAAPAAVGATAALAAAGAGAAAAAAAAAVGAVAASASGPDSNATNSGGDNVLMKDASPADIMDTVTDPVENKRKKSDASISESSMRRLIGKAKEVTRTRQLRSDTKAKRLAENMPKGSSKVDALLFKEAQSLAKTKSKPVRGTKQLEERLRREIELGRTSAAYVIDPGDSNPLPMMDFITRQQWGNVCSASLDASDDYL